MTSDNHLDKIITNAPPVYISQVAKCCSKLLVYDLVLIEQTLKKIRRGISLILARKATTFIREANHSGKTL